MHCVSIYDSLLCLIGTNYSKYDTRVYDLVKLFIVEIEFSVNLTQLQVTSSNIIRIFCLQTMKQIGFRSTEIYFVMLMNYVLIKLMEGGG